MRKLASVREVKEVKSHPNADNIELVIIDGWQCVALKGKHYVGEKVIYFEIDSVLPPLNRFEFLRKSCHIKKDWLSKGEGFRIKTIKLRGELSQGLVMSISDAFDVQQELTGRTLELGDDLTDFIGVEKYEPPVPACLEGEAKGAFPSLIRKTDQNRLQNCYDSVSVLDSSWEVSMKLEGTSMTIYHDLDGVFGVCSKNTDFLLNGNNEKNSFVNAYKDLIKNTNLSSLPKGLAVQGELMGPGIQGNIEKFNKLHFFAFDIFDIEKQNYLSSKERESILLKIGVSSVPLIEKTFCIKNMSIDELLNYADGPSIHAKNREGLVFKNLERPNISFKIISNKYLLKEK